MQPDRMDSQSQMDNERIACWYLRLGVEVH